MTCYHCDKEGYFKRGYPKRKKDLAMEEESNSNRTNVAESSDDEVALLLVIKGTDHTKDS